MCEQSVDLTGVIAVTNRKLAKRPFPEQIERICRAKPEALILREKDLSEEAYAAMAERVLEICYRYRIPCILHSYPKTAKRFMRGVHAGGDEKSHCAGIHLPLAAFMAEKEKDADFCKKFPIVGCSVHSVEDAVLAERLGASLLVAGHIYETDCKAGVPPRGILFLREVCKSVHIPVHAIGGIRLTDTGRPDAGQFREVADAGAAGVCVMSGCMKL